MAKPSEQEDERNASGPKVGALLQASRQRLGEELTDVASMLRIRLPYLVAIEAGRHQELPGATYAVGFIRAYAEHLGLDSEEVVRRFKVETIDGGEGDRKLSFPTPVPETGIPGGAYVFIGLVISILGYGAWYLSTTDDDLFVERVSPLNEQMTTLLSDDENGSGAAQAEVLVATLETAQVLSDDKLVKPEKLKSGNGVNATQAYAFPATVKEAITADTDTLGEIESEGIVDPLEPVVEAPSEPNPKPALILESRVKKLPTSKIEQINVKKPDVGFAKLGNVEKNLSVGEDTFKAIIEIEESSTPELKRKQKEVLSEVDVPVALSAEAAIAPPLLPADLESTVMLTAIETATLGSSRIKINAVNNSWIQIRDDNLNTMLVTRLLAAGDSYDVPDQPGLVLLTGNAGALEIIVDGIIVPSIGGVGIVRRGVVLEANRLKAGSAVSN